VRVNLRKFHIINIIIIRHDFYNKVCGKLKHAILFMNPLIFVVDDDLFFRNYICSLLLHHGFSNVKTFHSGEKCLAEMDSKPDMIILDHHMGDVSGSDVLKYLRKNEHQVPVVLISGSEENELIELVQNLGVKNFFKKDKRLYNHLRDYLQQNYQRQYTG
jgi:FixJ family two-component response regulator